VFADAVPDPIPYRVLKTQALVNQAAYQLGIRQIKPALKTIKEAILLSQEKDNFCLAQSYRLFSLVNISRQQVNETNEYLNFAIEHAEKSGNSFEICISAYYAAACQFLFGNISKAARLAQKSRENALASGLLDWADRVNFLQGRFAFETGFYDEALNIFETLRNKPLGRKTPEKDGLLAAWEYRVKAYFQNPLIRKPDYSGFDIDLFEMEAAYLAGNFRKTVKLAEKLESGEIKENYIFTEQPDWYSGFAQCELMYFSQVEIRKRMICVYHSLGLCHISPESSKDAIFNIRQILRDGQLSEMDPWDTFYFYAWYHILEHTDAEQIDMNTVVSMAFKRLQRRASRIDDSETRRNYLSRPRWNRELCHAAKEFRLI
jgi:hypothetical protein